MNGYGSHTYKLINDKQESVYVKFHFKTNQKIKNMDVKRADDLNGSDPDYSIRDLYTAIANEQFPSWTLKVQIMTFAQAETFKFNPFDLTKVWPQSEYPLHEVGKMVLDRNPKNYFAEVEQLAFSPSNSVPGIEASPDKMLQARLFAYADTQRHRLGANHLQLPVNCPFKVKPSTYQRDGPMNSTENFAGAPNYFPNSFSGFPEDERARKFTVPEKVSADIHRYSSFDTEDNYSQPAVFYNKVLSAEERTRLIQNIADSLSTASGFLQQRAIKMFANVSTDLSDRLASKLNLKTSSNL